MSSNDMPFATTHVGGVPFAITSLEPACKWLIEKAAVERLPINVRLANAYNVALASKDPDYFDLLTRQGINFPDGTPVVWFMNAGRSSRAQRVRGPSLFAHTMRISEPAKTRHFLLGGSPATLAQLETALRSTHPNLIIVGSYSPPYAPIDDSYVADCAEKISATNPDLVWMGLGTPKQDFLGTALAEQLRITTVNVGAAFDYSAGTVREAPQWIQRSGFEWLFRLASEPRRLWKRYLIGNIQFLVAACRTHDTKGTSS